MFLLQTLEEIKKRLLFDHFNGFVMNDVFIIDLLERLKSTSYFTGI